MSKRTRRAWSFLPAVVWMGVIFALSSRPKLPTAGLDVDLVAVAGHLTFYGVLALTFAWGLRREGVRSRRLFLLALVAAVAYGLTDELHQSLVPGRHPDPLDLIADALGAAAALLLARAFLRHRRRPAPS